MDAEILFREMLKSGNASIFCTPINEKFQLKIV